MEQSCQGNRPVEDYLPPKYPPIPITFGELVIVHYMNDKLVWLGLVSLNLVSLGLISFDLVWLG